MQKYINVLQDKFGNVMPGVSVLVTTYPAGTTPLIYSDNGITAIPNPIITDSNGNFAFYAASGRYQLICNLPRKDYCLFRITRRRFKAFGHCIHRC